MGLIKAFGRSMSTTLADQWIDYFYCDSLPESIIAVKGKKRNQNSSNTKGSENIISSGSIIAVADGQCMMIVEQGKIVEVCAEPGEYTFDSSTEPTIFNGDLSENIGRAFDTFGKRFTYGGVTPKDQRVYYFNTKELVGNRYGTPAPIPFRIVDERIGLDIDASITCFGTFSYRVSNPLLFYTNVCGNVTEPYNRSRIDEQLESELLTALQPAFAKISAMGIRYSELPSHTNDIANALNEVLSEKWNMLRGVEVVSFAIKGMKVSDEDARMIKELQRNAAFKDPTMAAAQLVGAQADAMQAAASNESAGPAMAFMGMNMAQNAGGINAGDLYSMGESQNKTQDNVNTGTSDGWTCSCGAVNTTNFCPKCGQKKPENNIPAFCSECGYNLSECAPSSKFCPNCGSPLK